MFASPPLLLPLPCLPLLLYSAGGHTSACSPPRSSAGVDRVPGGSWPPSPRTASVPLPADAGLAPQGPESICAPWRLRLDFALSAQHSPLPRVPLLHSRILCVAPPEGRLPEGRGLVVSLPAVPPVPGAWPVLRDTFAQWMRERTNEGEQGHRQQVAGWPEGPPPGMRPRPPRFCRETGLQPLPTVTDAGHQRVPGQRDGQAAGPPERLSPHHVQLDLAPGPALWCPKGLGGGEAPAGGQKQGRGPAAAGDREGGLLLLGPRPSTLPHLCTGPSQPHPFPSARAFFLLWGPQDGFEDCGQAAAGPARPGWASPSLGSISETRWEGGCQRLSEAPRWEGAGRWPPPGAEHPPRGHFCLCKRVALNPRRAREPHVGKRPPTR